MKTSNPSGSPYGNFVEAQRLDASGHPMGFVFRFDPAPPTIPGYHDVYDSAPHVAYSPSSDSWVVAFTAAYVQNAPCRPGYCSYLDPVLLVHVDAAGQIVGNPTILVVQNPTRYVAADIAVACRAGGCMLVWAKCLSAACPGSVRPALVALPLDPDGVPLSSSPVKISTGLCQPHAYLNLPIGPDGATLASTNQGYIVDWIATGDGNLDFPGCAVLRPISPTGQPIGPEVLVGQHPKGLRRSVTPIFFNQQVCSYQGGRRALVTWLVGEGTVSSNLGASDLKYVGLYRQIYSSQGKLVGRNTRAVLSFSDVSHASDANRSVGEEPGFKQTLASDPWQNRCVALTRTLNKVDAYAYDSAGQLRQQANLLRSHYPTGFTVPGAVDAVWSGRGALLFDFHFAPPFRPGTLFAYPLR